MSAPRQVLRKTIAAVSAAIFLALAAFCSADALPRTPAAGTASEATITYRKIFKSSYPEFTEIKISESGSGTFDIRQLEETSNPQPFQIDPALAQQIFSLAAKLHDFQGVDLDVHRRIANLGQKTFIYQMGGETHQVEFNYTLDQNATQLLVIFEGLERQESDLSNLQRTMRYDPLGVNDAIMQIESDYNNKTLPEPERFLAALDQVAADQQYVNVARDKARTLAHQIRSSH